MDALSDVQTSFPQQRGDYFRWTALVRERLRSVDDVRCLDKGDRLLRRQPDRSQLVKAPARERFVFGVLILRGFWLDRHPAEIVNLSKDTKLLSACGTNLPQR